MRHSYLDKFITQAKVFFKATDKHYETKNRDGKEESEMRIDAYAQVQQVYQTQKVNRSQKTGNAVKSDKVQISSLGKEIQTAKAAVAGSPDIREELTAPIKARIQSGTYEVSNSSFAEKLLQKFEEVR